MTPQEQDMIDGLVERIRNTPVNDKDVQAEQHLQQGLAGCPDAIYVLAQTVLVQQYGLQTAQSQIQDLQAQLEQLRHQQAPPSGGGSFLSHLFGSGNQTPPPGPGYGPSQVPYQQVNNAGYPPPPPQYGSPYPPAYGQPMGYGPPSGGGGFLRGAMQTAAGVAAGEMMFEGMESLFHGFGGGHEGSGFDGGGGESVVNNYYGESGDHGSAGRDDSSFYNPDHDASRGGGSDSDSRQFADTKNDTGAASDDNNDTSYDDNSDDSSYDSGDDGNSSSDDSL